MEQEHAVWQSFEAPFRQALESLGSEERDSVRLALRCLAFFDAFPYGDKDELGDRGVLVLRELCAPEAPCRSWFIAALQFLQTACAQISPWLGRAENIENARVVAKVDMKVKWVRNGLDDTEHMTRTQRITERDRKILLHDIILAFKSFEPELQTLLVNGLGHLPDILAAASD